MWKKNDKRSTDNVSSVRSGQKTRPGGKGKGGAGCKARPGKGKRQKMKNRKAWTLLPHWSHLGTKLIFLVPIFLLMWEQFLRILKCLAPATSASYNSRPHNLWYSFREDATLSGLARWRCQSGSTWWRLTSGWFSIPVLACSIFLNLNFNKNWSSRKELAPYDED